MPKPIRQQVIVITGASSGIGLATAREAAWQGARVIMAARNERDLEREAEKIRREGGEALAVPTDVTVFEQVEALARAAVDAFGRIDTWVNNAAVTAYAPFKEQSLEDFRRVFETVFVGQLHGAKVALPLLEQTEGALICIGSVASDRGIPLQGAYCAAKHALKGWLDALRVELMHEGSKVRVTLVKPSSMNTPLFSKAKTQLGVQPMPIPPIYEPELAADAILRAAEGSERDVFVGGASKALSLAEHISPKLVDLQMRSMGFQTQKTNWPKREDAPNNLYEPVDHDGGLRGEFLNVKQHSSYQQLASRPKAASLSAAAALGFGAAVLAQRSERRTLPALLTLVALTLLGKDSLTSFYDG